MNNFNLLNKSYLLNFCILSLFFDIGASHHVRAQKLSGENYVALEVGDTVPNHEFLNILNYGSKTAKLSDFRGKLLILDFWATTCGSCIASWPKILELQKKYSQEVQIVLVNPSQDKNTVTGTFQKRKKYAGVDMTLPAVYEDPHIKKLFPYNTLPTVAWISKNGMVLSITSGDFLNEKNIKKILDGEELNVPQKIQNYSEYIRIDATQPLFVDSENGMLTTVFGQSIFTKSNRKLLGPRLVVADSSIGYFASSVNTSIKLMYMIAYNDERVSTRQIEENRVFLEMNDKSKYLGFNEYEERVLDNFYTYKLTMTRATSKEQLREMMRQDLQRYIGLDAKMKKRVIPCLVFSISDKTKVPVYKDKGEYPKTKVKDSGLLIGGLTFDALIENMSASSPYGSGYSPFPLLNETGYKGKFGLIKSNINASDYKQLDKALQKYGIRFTLEEREMDVLVLTEPEGYVFPFENTNNQKQ